MKRYNSLNNVFLVLFIIVLILNLHQTSHLKSNLNKNNVNTKNKNTNKSLSLSKNNNLKSNNVYTKVLYSTKGIFFKNIEYILQSFINDKVNDSLKVNSNLNDYGEDTIYLKEDFTLSIESEETGNVKSTIKLEKIMLLCREYTMICSFKELENLLSDDYFNKISEETSSIMQSLTNNSVNKNSIISDSNLTNENNSNSPYTNTGTTTTLPIFRNHRRKENTNLKHNTKNNNNNTLLRKNKELRFKQEASTISSENNYNKVDLDNCILLLTEKHFSAYHKSNAICFLNKLEAIKFKHIISEQVFSLMTSSKSVFNYFPLVFEDNFNLNSKQQVALIFNYDFLLLSKGNHSKIHYSIVEDYFKFSPFYQDSGIQEAYKKTSNFYFTFKVIKRNDSKKNEIISSLSYTLKHLKKTPYDNYNEVYNNYSLNSINLILLRYKVNKIIETFNNKRKLIMSKKCLDLCGDKNLKPLYELIQIKYFIAKSEINELLGKGIITEKEESSYLVSQKEEIFLEACQKNLLCHDFLVNCESIQSIFSIEKHNLLEYSE